MKTNKSLTLLAGAALSLAVAGPAAAATYGAVSLGEQMLPNASLPALTAGMLHTFRGGSTLGLSGGGGRGDGVTSNYAALTYTSRPLTVNRFSFGLYARAGADTEIGASTPNQSVLYLGGGAGVGARISRHTRAFASYLATSGGGEQAAAGVAVSFTPSAAVALSDSYFRLDSLRSHTISLSLIQRF